MKIHIAASVQNIADVQRVALAIKEAGHEVWDWTQEEPPSKYDDCAQWDLYRIPRHRYFRILSNSCTDADLVVSIGTGDFEAGRVVGIAYALDIPVMSIIDERSERGFMDELNHLPSMVHLLKQIYPPSGLSPLQNKTEGGGIKHDTA